MNRKFASIDGFKNRRTSSVAKKTATNMAYYKPRVVGQKKLSNSAGVVNTVSQPIKRAVAQLANREALHQRSSVIKKTSSPLLSHTKKEGRESGLFKKRIPEKQLEDFLDVSNSTSNPSSRPKKNKNKKRIIFKVILFIIVLAVCALIYRYASRLMKAANVIGGGNIIDIFKKEPLKQDHNGRTNFLLFGTESDNIHSEHGGPLLTDSLMVVSYNNNTKQASMISVPRDLWIKHEKTCFVGNYSKINTVYQCGSDSGKNQKTGAEFLIRKISQVIGLDIQYYVHIQFQAVIQLVDAVGGVEVIIESPDPRGIYDPNFDWQCNYQCNLVKYKNGPTGLMNGQKALALMRARNAQGGYGLPNSNFDREDNQRKVLIALAKKITGSSVVTDIEKMSSILEALGNNLRTNLNTKEVRSMMATMKEIANQFETNSIESISLIEVVKNDSINGQSVIVPIDGIEQYRIVHNFIQKHLNGQSFIKEKPSVVVLNGSKISGMAQKLADQLAERGFEVVRVGNASEDIQGGGLIFKKTNSEKPQSYSYLQKTYNFIPDSDQQTMYDNESADFVLIIGPDTVIK